MNSTMRIRFADDMPVASVEVITSDLQTVGHLAVKPGVEREIAVPSDRSFIRIHLPSGRIVTRHHDGDLRYEINRASLLTSYTELKPKVDHFAFEAGAPSRSVQVDRRDRRKYLAAFHRSRRGGSFKLRAPSRKDQLHDGTRAIWEPDVFGYLLPEADQIHFEPEPRRELYVVRVERPDGTGVVVRLPGHIRSASLRVDAIDEGRRVVSLRASTFSEEADTVGSYLERGDFYAAQSMSGWAEEAEGMLQGKDADPYAAAIGAYLLLRLQDYDRMHNWAKNLADWFEFLSDGCVIWGCQALAERGDEDEAAAYFEQALERGLPVFTEGLRLLSQNLPRMGASGREALQKLNQEAGRVHWKSPFTAQFVGRPVFGETVFNVGYMPLA